jgi:hypothetical protein
MTSQSPRGGMELLNSFHSRRSSLGVLVDGTAGRCRSRSISHSKSVIFCCTADTLDACGGEDFRRRRSDEVDGERDFTVNEQPLSVLWRVQDEHGYYKRGVFTTTYYQGIAFDFPFPTEDRVSAFRLVIRSDTRHVVQLALGRGMWTWMPEAVNTAG